MLRDPPEIGAGGHPAGMSAVEARQVDGAGVCAEGPLAAEVDVVVEVAHDQLAQRAVDGRTAAESREVRLGDGAPVAVRAVDGDDVVRVLDRLQIQQQGRKAKDAQLYAFEAEVWGEEESGA